MKALARIAWRNVLLNWRHSVTALISIAAGFVSLSVFQSYLLDVQLLNFRIFQTRFMHGHVMIEKKGVSSRAEENWDLMLDPTDQDFIEGFLGAKRSEVKRRVRFLNVSGSISNGGAQSIFMGYGYDIAEGLEMRGQEWGWNAVSGHPLKAASPESSVVIGTHLSELVNCHTENPGSFAHMKRGGGYIPVERPFKCDRLPLQLTVSTEAGQANAIDVTPVGLVDAAFIELDRRYLAMSLSTAQKLFDTKRLSHVSVELESGVDPQIFSNQMMEAARNRQIELSVMPWQTHTVGDFYTRTMDLLTTFRNFVVAVILIIVGLSILNTMVRVVTERTREIGTLRSIGYRSNQIILLFLMEATLLSMIGIGFGLFASLGISGVINAISFPYKAGMFSEPVPFRVAVSFEIYLKSGAFLLLVALLSSLLPTTSASRRKVSELLTHV